MCNCIWNDGYRETVRKGIDHSEANTIDSNRTLFHGDISEGRIIGEGENPAPIILVFFNTGPYLIHMSLNNMPVQASTQHRTAFQIDLVTTLQGAEIALCQRFRNSRHLVQISFHPNHCQTNPIVGNTLIDLQFLRNIGLDSKGDITTIGFPSYYLA